MHGCWVEVKVMTVPMANSDTTVACQEKVPLLLLGGDSSLGGLYVIPTDNARDTGCLVAAWQG